MIRIVIVEDVPNEAELAMRELRRAGIAFDARRVETADQYRRELEQFKPQLILADFTMPNFDGMEALAITKRSNPDIPFIFVSATIGEENAVRALKNGATDYILKGNLLRLPAAVERAIKEDGERRARQALTNQLRESEKRYRELFQSNPHPMWVYDIETLRFLAVNDTALSRYGFSHEEFLAMTIREIYPAKDLPRLLGRVAQVLPTAKEPEAWQHLTKDGKLLDIEIASHDLAFEGRPARVVVAYNVTARKRTEEALRESETRLRAIIENEPECVKVVSGDGKLLEINRAGLTMLQAKSLAEAQQQSLLAFIVPEHRAAFGDLHDRVMKGGRGTVEFEVIGLKGTRCWLETTAAPLRNAAGEVQHLLGITRDVTERKHAEQALRESEANYRQLIEQAPDGIFISDALGNYLLVNSRGCELLGYAEHEVLDMNAKETYLEEEKEIHAERLELLRAGQILHFERSVKRKDGSVFPADVSLKMLDNGMIQMIFHDITKRRVAEALVRESEARFRSFVEQSPDAMIIHQANTIVFVNTAMVRLMRADDTGTLLGKQGISLLHAGHANMAEQRRARLYSGQTVPLIEQVYVRSDGTTVDVEVAASPIGLNGKPAALVTVREITERKEQERKIARLSRIQQVLSGINAAIVRIRDRQELFEEACRIAVQQGGFSIGWIAILNHASGTLAPVAQAGLPIDLGTGGDSSDGPVRLAPWGTAEVALREKRPAFDNNIERSLGEMGSERGGDTLSVRRAAVSRGAKSVIVLPLYVEGKTFGILTLYAPERNFFDDEELKLLNEMAGDISFGLEFIAKQEKVDHLAYYDALTGLPNRSLFSERLSTHLHTRAESPELVAVVLMDVEHFRMVNDTFGRQTGDELIRLIGRRLESNAAASRCSNPARIGGDAFGIIIRGANDAIELAYLLEEGMRAVFGGPFITAGKEVRLIARAGLSVYPTDGSTAESLLHNAEAALRKAKQANERFAFYAPEMNARAAEFMILENKLRKAIELEQFVLHYQPKFNIATGKTSGIEALIRWNDPDTGLVPPLQFIQILEETGMILEVGRWALRQALADQQRWRAKGLPAPRVAVNVSAQQLRDQHFVRDVQLALASQEGLKPALELEITESLLMENIERNVERLNTLRDLGVTIAIDDFGTGYSSLNYLAKLPMDTLKIDRSFVAGMTVSLENTTIVATIISLAHSLGLKVVAEGVETEAQLNHLRLLKCDEMQGFLLGRPVASEDIASVLSRYAQNTPATKPNAVEPINTT